ncbi:MAG: ANTAR domain-containing protein [Actinobacteria bacterium]|nr:ANTAR domain-containing protein [Actinomycetota bacterium]
MRLSQQLNQAMASRASIEQAKGILMGAQGRGPDEAIQMASHRSRPWTPVTSGTSADHPG